MKKRGKKIAVILSILLISFMGAAQASAATVTQEVETGLSKLATKNAGLFEGVTLACFESGQCSLCDILIVLINISNVILSTFALLALVFFIWGAAYLMFSSGNEERVTKGKAIIKATIIGSIFVLVAWQLMAYIVFVLISGSGNELFSTKDLTGNHITTWYDAAGRCSTAQQGASSSE